MRFDVNSEWSALKGALVAAHSNYGPRALWKPDDECLIARLGSGGLNWPSPLFPQPSKHTRTVAHAIGGIVNRQNWRGGADSYSEMLEAELPSPIGIRETGMVLNHEFPEHGPITEARFRIMQELALQGIRPRSSRSILQDEYCLRALMKMRVRFSVMNESDTERRERRPRSRTELKKFLHHIATSKHAQRCLDASRPAPSQLSIPDDFVHYDLRAPRVLTIREMARIQSFPDWFEFRSKRTTGGSSRAYEVPQYTQVGNAVPPLLAKRLGESIRSFLDQLESR